MNPQSLVNKKNKQLNMYTYINIYSPFSCVFFKNNSTSILLSYSKF